MKKDLVKNFPQNLYNITVFEKKITVFDFIGWVITNISGNLDLDSEF